MRSRAATAFVWMVWLAMLAGAVAFVATYGSRVLMQDDMTIVDARWWGTRDLLTRLWNLHNEHRIPLPRAILWTVDALTGDVRASSYLSIAVLAAVAAGMIAAARALRGRTSAADAFFPLLWLHTGNCENLLMGFQLTLALATALVCVILLVTIVRAPSLSPRAAWVCAACCVALPLCGGPGMLQGPVLAVWLGLLGIRELRQGRRGDAPARRAGRILLAGVALTAVVGALYMLDFRLPTEHTRNHDVGAILAVAGRVVALGLGQAAAPWWPWSGVFVVVFASSAAGLALHAWRREPDQRWRAGAILAGLLATTAMALGIGIARGTGDAVPGFAQRYIGLQAPLLCTAYLAWVRFGPRAGATAATTFVTWGVTLVMAIADVSYNAPLGHEYGVWRRSVGTSFERDVEAGMGCRMLVLRYGNALDNEPTRFVAEMIKMTRLGIHPFDRYPASGRASLDWPMFDHVPRAIEGQTPPAARKIDDHMALTIAGRCGLTFDVPPGSRHVVGTFGALDRAWQVRKYVPARLEVLAVDAEGTRTLLLSRALEPVTNESDRGAQRFRADLGDGSVRTIAIRVEPTDANEARTAWLWLRDVDFLE